MTYDALGRRVSRTAGGTTTNFQYAGNAVLLELQGSTATATYTFGNGLLRKDGEYPLFDGLGSERTVTNSSQTVSATANYDSFGNTVGTSGSSTDSYMFGATWGYRNDGDVGLMHVGARYYDAQVGRFATRDSLLTQLPYVYCGGDPVNWIDPTGHQCASPTTTPSPFEYFMGGAGVLGAGLGVAAAGLGVSLAGLGDGIAAVGAGYSLGSTAVGLATAGVIGGLAIFAGGMVLVGIGAYFMGKGLGWW